VNPFFKPLNVKAHAKYITCGKIFLKQLRNEEKYAYVVYNKPKKSTL
jgi:hypothetical protein